MFTYLTALNARRSVLYMGDHVRICHHLLEPQGHPHTVRSNELLITVMVVVIGMFIVLAIRYIFQGQGWSGFFSYKPFIIPKH